MSENSFNVRGTLFAPLNKQQINYNICLMDVPEGVSATDFQPVNCNPAYVNNPEAAEDVCMYNCLIDLSGFESMPPTKTIALPMFTFSPYKFKTDIEIKDLAGNVYKGNPNKGVPPRVELNANPDSDYTTTNFIVSSLTFSEHYYIVVIASSKGVSVDVSNYFRSMVLNENNLVCTLETSGGASTYQAPIGVFTTSLNQVLTTQVAGGNIPTNVDWDGSVFAI